MSHPIYASGNPRFNHVAMSLPADMLGESNRGDLCRYFGEVLGFDAMPTMTIDRKRLIFSCVHWDQFIFLIAEDDPMKCPRMDHYGFAVQSLEEIRGAGRAREQQNQGEARHSTGAVPRWDFQNVRMCSQPSSAVSTILTSFTSS